MRPVFSTALFSGVLLGLVFGNAGFAQAGPKPYAVPQTITSVAGTGAAGAAGNGAAATQALLNADQGVAIDAFGDIYIADSGNNVVREIDAHSGVITVYAGGASTYCAGASDGIGNNCPATEALLNRPTQVTVTAAGDLLISDYGNSQVRIVNHQTHKITAFAGYYGGFGGDGGPANKALLYAPGQTAVDAAGNVYIADTNNHVIRAVANPAGPATAVIAGVSIAAGNIATIAGTPKTVGAAGDGAPATAATLDYPTGVALDASGNIYIADSYNFKIRVIYVSGTVPGLSSLTANDIYTFAGGGTNYNSGASTLTAKFGKPVALQIDPNGNMYVVDASYQRVELISSDTATVTVAVAGGSLCTGATDAYGDGCTGPHAKLAAPLGAALDTQGNLFVADTGDNLVREVATGAAFGSASSKVSNTLVFHYVPGDQPSSANSFQIHGSAQDFTLTSGPACGGTAATGYNCNFTVAFSPSAAGVRSTYATLNSYHSVTQLPLSGSGQVPAASMDPGTVSTLSSTLAGATGTATDNSGNIYIADSGHNQILLYTAATKAISVLAGTGTPGYAGDGAAATAALLNAPQAVAVDVLGNVYIADTNNNAVREIAAGTGLISTILGNGQAGYTGDGGLPSAAQVNAPAGIAVDARSNLYIADTGNEVIRQISNGVVQTIAGGAAAICGSSADAFGDSCSALQARLNHPTGLSLDSSGNLLIADTGNSMIRKVVASSGVIEAVAGTGAAGLSGDGVLASQAQLSSPTSAVTDAAGAVFIVDAGNNLVRKIDASGTLSTVAGSTSGSLTATAANLLLLSGPTGLAIDGAANLYVADSGNARLLMINRSLAALSLGSTNVGASSAAQSVTLSNAGPASLALNSPLYTATGSSTFAVQPSSTCAAGNTLAPGVSCSLAFVFSPTAAGPAQQSLSFSTSGVGAQPALALTATGTQLAATTIVLSAPGLAGGTDPYLQAFTVNATVAAQTAGSGTPTGSLTFSVDGVPQPVVALGNGAAALSLNGLSAGPHSIQAAYGGDSVYASNPGGTPLAVTVIAAPTTAALTLSTSAVSLNQAVTFTAIVGTTAGTPTGLVSFNNGSAVLGTAPVNAAGTAVLTTSTLPLGSYSVTAVYGGDTNHQISTSTAAQLTVSQAPTSLSVASFATGELGITVAADGTGNYTTVGAALAALPSSGGVVYIKPGTYKEVVTVKQNNVQLRGLGTDPTQTVITFNNGGSTLGANGLPLGTGGSSTFYVKGNNFYAENVTIQNTFDLENSQDLPNSQALALSATGDRAIFNNIRLIGRQDTLYAAENCSSSTACNDSRQYFYNSYIEGNVDYIFGNSQAIFDHCTIHSVYHDNAAGEATITAQNKSYAAQASGYVFNRSLFTSEADAGAMQQLFLGRPYGSLSTVVLLNNNLQASINAAGWIEFVPGTTNNLPTSYYGEYNSFGPGATGPREQYAVTLTPAQAAGYEAPLYLAGTDSWDPENVHTITANQSLNYNVVISAPNNAVVPTGTVTYSVDGTPLAPVALVNGAAPQVIGGLAPGQHTIVANYSGDASYAAATSSSVVVAVGASLGAETTQTVLTANASQIAPGTSVLLSAAVTASTPTDTPFGSVTFMSGTTPLATVPVSQGVASLSTTLTGVLGSYSITAVFTGEAQFSNSTSNALTVAVQPIATTLNVQSTAISASSVTVAADGTGNYLTVGAAVKSLPVTGGTIYIKPGTYKEVVEVDGNNVSLIGLGTDPSQVVITYNNSHGTLSATGTMLGTAGSATFSQSGTNFYAENITFQNTFDIENNQDLPNSQAVALSTTGDRAIFYNDRFIGRQDTLYAGESCGASSCTQSRQYFYNSYIEGNVDYIFGNSQAVFDHCTINTLYHDVLNGETTIFAQNKTFSGQPSGYVVTNSTLEAESDQGLQTKYYLGRPYGPLSTVILVNNMLTGVPVPAGWVEFTPGVTNSLPTSYFAEYGSTGPGANGPREQYAVTLTQAQTALYVPTTYLAGTDGWNPQSSPVLSFGKNLLVNIGVSPVNGIGTPTGTVSFSVDGGAAVTATVANGMATQTLSGFTIGQHTITYNYSGDTNFVASTGSETINVGFLATTTNLSASSTAVAANAPVTLTTTVVSAGAMPTGTITFLANGYTFATATLNAKGVAILTATAPYPGTYAVTASYGGDAQSAPSVSPVVNVSVGIGTAPTVTTLSAAATTVANGAPDLLTASVASTGTIPTGTITFSADGYVLGSAPLNASGVATLLGSSTLAGTYPVIATYSGDPHSAASVSQPVAVTVNP